MSMSPTSFAIRAVVLLVVASSLFLGAPSQVAAQDQKGDSLIAVWKDASRPDSVRYSACFDLIMEVLLYTWPDSAQGYAEELERFTSERKMIKAQGSAMNLIASCEWTKGEYAAARSAFLRAMAFCEHHNDQRGVAVAMANIGTLFMTQGQTDSAEIFMRKGMDVLRKSGDNAVSYTHLDVYKRQLQYGSAPTG